MQTRSLQPAHILKPSGNMDIFFPPLSIYKLAIKKLTWLVRNTGEIVLKSDIHFPFEMLAVTSMVTS